MGGCVYNGAMVEPAADQKWTTRRLLRWTGDYLKSKGVDSPRLAAEMLLAHVLHADRIKLYTDADRPANDAERMVYRELVQRAAEHEPVQYLVGKAYFFALDFQVSPAVLIPRPSTETLVEHVIQHARRSPGFADPVIADIGTGSGAIAVALAKNLPDAHVLATDISGAALEVARANARRHGVADRIDFREGSLFEPLSGRYHFICANPPYISDAEWEQVAPNVRDYEPTAALRAGADGLDLMRPLIAGAGDYLEHPGQLVLEFAASQKQAVLELAKLTAGLADPHVLPDAEGHPRVLVANRA